MTVKNEGFINLSAEIGYPGSVHGSLGPSQALAPGLGRRQPGAHAVPNQLPLEFGDAALHTKRFCWGLSCRLEAPTWGSDPLEPEVNRQLPPMLSRVHVGSQHDVESRVKIPFRSQIQIAAVDILLC